MKRSSVTIYMTVGNITTMLQKARNAEVAELYIKGFEKQDRYEIETEGYKMPAHWGGKYPVYSYK